MKKKAQIGILLSGVWIFLILIVLGLIIAFVPALLLWFLQHFAGIIMIGVAFFMLIFAVMRGKELFESKPFIAIVVLLFIGGFMFTFIPKLATLGAIGNSPYILYVCEYPIPTDLNQPYPRWSDANYMGGNYEIVKWEAREYAENYGCNNDLSDYKYSVIGDITPRVYVVWYEVCRDGAECEAKDNQCRAEGNVPWGLGLMNTNDACPVPEEPEQPDEPPIDEPDEPTPPEPDELNLWQTFIAWLKSLFSGFEWI